MITISLCMIVKNEERILARCLDSVKDLVDEIIIVDTGSADATKRIAAEYTDKIYDFTWIDDFSAARNFAFSKAVLEEAGIDTDTAVIAVVTNDFHLFRACLIARREGLTTVGIPAELPWWWLSANYYLRESFAVVKTVLFD